MNVLKAGANGSCFLLWGLQQQPNDETQNKATDSTDGNGERVAAVLHAHDLFNNWLFDNLLNDSFDGNLFCDNFWGRGDWGLLDIDRLFNNFFDINGFFLHLADHNGFGGQTGMLPAG